ncbi:HD-GYP domain-containing protein [Evansella tamaricis]|uniref:HD-GYP domain-containing protein n=1 Tax=Evansella tamaricis TaxID=2069301 RepID=A0ABS6JDS2_9BACI|nr:HD-GYP domain-containing protein [Evansella tamaricis]MBU9711801.1 HD-GYP domain-containing protein [Evansella tamaricis]
MNVKTEYLIPGCIVKSDIFKHSNFPLIRKNTILSEELIFMLHTFLIPSVAVESTLADGSVFKPNEIISENGKNNEVIDSKSCKSFFDQFLISVEEYKKLFTQWQGGSKVEAYSIRTLFLPLYEKNPTKTQLMQLHQFGLKSDYIYYHAVSLSVLSYMVGKKMNLSNGEVIQLGISALLSDCGMSKVPSNLFEKKGPLTIEEYEEVKKHPLLGYRMLENVPGFSKGAMLGILQHHEREDESGYPMQLKGNRIHLYAKIISICDIYHAMTYERYYRKKKSPYRVIESLQKDHFGKVDHVVLNAFLKMLLNLSIGTKVRLNNGLIGEIIFMEETEPTRPMLKVNNYSLLPLKSHPELYIEEIIEDVSEYIS